MTEIPKFYMNIEELKNWEENPRGIDAIKYEDLKESLKQDDQLMPLLVDMRPGKEGTVLGGNMTLRALRELGVTKVWVDPKTPRSDAHALELAIKHNANYGRWNQDNLAEIVDKFKEDLNLKALPVELAPAVDLAHLLLQYSPEQIQHDEDETDEKLETYLHGSIRQIVLYFTVEEYEKVLARLKIIMEKEGKENNTDIFTFLLDFYESTTQKTSG